MNDPFEHGDRPLVPFAQTRWSLISGSRDPERAEKALSDLCEIYWYPVYAFIRRQGKSHDETEDLVQGLFQSLLERETFQKADRSRGRLRSYLCVAAKRHLISVSRYQQRLKRGGNMRFVPYDEEAAHLHYNQTCCDNVSPEIEFDRSWATAVIKSTFKELERYYEAKGKLKLMKAMIPFLKSDLSEGQQGPVAETFDMNVNAFRTQVYRFRQRYGEHLRQIVADTLREDEDIDEEVQYLLRLFQ